MRLYEIQTEINEKAIIQNPNEMNIGTQFRMKLKTILNNRNPMNNC